MTVPLCTIDIIAYLARPDVAATNHLAAEVPATPRASPRFYNWVLTSGRRDPRRHGVRESRPGWSPVGRAAAGRFHLHRASTH